MTILTKPQIKSEITSSSANGLLGGTILTNIVDSYQNQYVVNVMDYGAAGDNSTDDSAAFAAAIAAAQIQGNTQGPSGYVYVPPNGYVLKTGVTLPRRVRLVGAGTECTYLSDGGNNTNPVVTMSGAGCSLENMTIFGCGRPGTNDPRPTQPTVLIPNNGQDAPYIHRCLIYGGFTAIKVMTQDVVLDNCSITNSYSNAIVEISNVGQVWAHRTSFDQQWPQSLPAGGTSLPSAWAASTTYALGALARISGVTSQVVAVTGDSKSGSVTPTMGTYNTSIVDNHVTWQPVFYDNNYTCILVDSNSTNENYFDQCDFSTAATYGIRANSSGLSFIGLHNCVFGQQSTAAIRIDAVTQMYVSDCEVTAGWANGFAIWTVAGATGNLVVDGSWIQGNGGSTRAVTLSSATMTGAIVKGNFIGAQGSTGHAILTDVGVGNFIISENIFYNWSSGDSVLVSVGGADHYNIVNNLIGGSSVVDGGTGANKTVSGNH